MERKCYQAIGVERFKSIKFTILISVLDKKNNFKCLYEYSAKGGNEVIFIKNMINGKDCFTHFVRSQRRSRELCSFATVKRKFCSFAAMIKRKSNINRSLNKIHVILHFNRLCSFGTFPHCRLLSFQMTDLS